MILPDIVKDKQNSYVQKDRPIKWDAYKVTVEGDIVVVKRSLCDRCQKVHLPDGHLIRTIEKFEDIGEVHLLTGICRACIQTKEYDKYLDGKALSRNKAGELWVKYLTEYEEAWTQVLRSSPVVALTEKGWLQTCKYFNGCAVCGGAIEVRTLFFPSSMGGAYTAWNVIPLCEQCQVTGKFNRRRDRKNKQFDPRKNFTKGCTVFKNINMFYKTKTIRVYLLNQMYKHNMNTEVLTPYLKRFFETKRLDIE